MYKIGYEQSHPTGMDNEKYKWGRCPNCGAKQWVSASFIKYDDTWMCEGPNNEDRGFVSISRKGCGKRFDAKEYLRSPCTAGRSLCRV